MALLTDAVARADQAEQGREAARKRAHELSNRMLVVQGAADRAEAEADAEELRQAEEARQGRGRLARAWRAWRGQ